jgi:flagellin
MVINTNTSALNAANNLNASSAMLNQSLARLSSGSKIVNASDDPAGLAESNRLTSQISRVGAANANVANAISFSQTQDGFLQQIGSALDQMSTLALQAQDVTKTSSDLTNYQAEFAQLQAYVTSASSQTFNGVSLFSSSALSVTIDSSGTGFSMSGINLSASAYTTATGSGTTVSSSTSAATALTAVNSAITQLSTDRATVGANEARLNYTASQLSVLSTNLTAANSQISDVDVATESTNYAKYQILVQSGTSMLAQANQQPQSVLKLLA